MYKLLHKIFGAYTLSVPVRDGIRLVNILNRKKILFWGVRNTGDSICFKASLFSCEACIKIQGQIRIDFGQLCRTLSYFLRTALYLGDKYYGKR